MTRAPLFFVRDPDERLKSDPGPEARGEVELGDLETLRALGREHVVVRFPEGDGPLAGLYLHPAWLTLPLPPLQTPSEALTVNTWEEEDIFKMADKYGAKSDLPQTLEDALDDVGYTYEEMVAAGDTPAQLRRLLDLCVSFDGVEFADSVVNYPEWRHLDRIFKVDQPLAEAAQQLWCRAGASRNADEALWAWADQQKRAQ